MGWRVRWWVHIWTGGIGVGSMVEDREGVRATHVDSVAALRDLIMQVRADPTVRRFTHGPYDELDHDDEPTHCVCGRELGGHRSTAAECGSRGCAGCPGHTLYRCRGCSQVTVWPAPGPDCRPSTVDRRRVAPPFPGDGGPRTR